VFSPDSVGLLLVLGTVAVTGVVVVAGRRRLGLRVGVAVVALVSVFSAGVLAVNGHFGYFSTWADVSAGLGAGPTATLHRGPVATTARPPGDPWNFVDGPRPTAVTAPRKGVLSRAQVDAVVGRLPRLATGTVLSVPLIGPRSRIDRRGLVWLPPQYRAPGYARTRFPVVELIPGTPGQPLDWVHYLHLTNLLAALTITHRIGPMVVVVAPSNPRRGHGQECTNRGSRGAQDSTYMGVDVPAAITTAFRVFAPGPHWAVGGYSTGGYCATDLTLKHPGTYGAVADLDGYLSPLEDGRLWHVIFNRNRVAIRAYTITAELRGYHHRLPPFLLAAGRANGEDLRDLITLRAVLSGRTTVTSLLTPGGHAYPVWRAELPTMLTWIWTHIHPTGRAARHPIRHHTGHRATPLRGGR